MNDFLMAWFVGSVCVMLSFLLVKIFEFIEMCNRAFGKLQGYSLYIMSSNIDSLKEKMTAVEEKLKENK